VPSLRVVLVRPEGPANIGACARVVRNTGLAGLDLVAPGDWRTVECWRTAWGAPEVLEEARVFPDLPSALVGANWVVALSGRRDPGVPVLDVREMAAAAAVLGPEDEGRLVFGPESTGLRLEELALCGRLARIPSHPSQPSLNLSHAVAVVAYEVFRAGRRTPPGSRRASHDEKERMIGLVREGLLAIEALPPVNTDGYFRQWHALFARADLTPKEVNLLEHMARRMLRARDLLARSSPRGPGVDDGDRRAKDALD
jgi:TrmH family RNA methyltransferase